MWCNTAGTIAESPSEQGVIYDLLLKPRAETTLKIAADHRLSALASA